MTEFYDTSLDLARSQRVAKMLVCGSLEGCGATLLEMADGRRQLLNGSAVAPLMSQLFEQNVQIETGRCLEHSPAGGYNAIAAG